MVYFMGKDIINGIMEKIIKFMKETISKEKEMVQDKLFIQMVVYFLEHLKMIIWMEKFLKLVHREYKQSVIK